MYTYSFATIDEGEEIADLLENTAFSGEISLAYCRRPNAVLSLEKEGDFSAFVIAKENSKIIAAGGCVIKNNIAYLTGLRAEKTVNIPKCYKMLRDFCAEHNATLTYTTILSDNISVQKMLEKKRPNMPVYLRYGECVIHIIRKNLCINDKNTLEFQNGFFVLKNPLNEEIAKAKAIEQYDFKQYVVKHYGSKMRFLKKIFKWIPNENEILKFFTLSEVTATDEKSLESLLRHMSRIDKPGEFFLYGGLNTSCPVKSISYKSIVYIVDWDKNITDLSDIKLNFEIADL
jgi:uncharacterized protein YerC